MSELEKISFIGCGKVGRTIGRALKTSGYQIGAIVARKQSDANDAVEFIGAGLAGTDAVASLNTASVHIIAANDDSIPAIVDSITTRGPESLKNHYFFHMSGALSSNVLEPLQKKGADTGSIHPLQVFADPAKAVETLPGIYYAIEGNDRAMELAVQIVDRLQGKLLLVPTGRKVLYHVAGVFAANYLTVLVNYVLHIMEEIGEDPEEAYQAFLPLMVGALENIESFGVGEALTGPIARGDMLTIQKHLEALQQLEPEVLEAYKLLGKQAVEIASKAGKISPERAKKITELL